MNMIKRILLSFTALATLSALAACGGPEDDFKEAIEKQMVGKECYSLRQQRSVEDFPLVVKRGILSGNELHPILAGMENSKLVSIESRGRGYKAEDVIELTNLGKQAAAWDDKDGFCVGQREIVEIVRYTYGDNGQNENIAEVEYTWKLGNLPDWVDPQKFSGVTGMTEPQTGRTIVQKSSDGWHAGF